MRPFEDLTHRGQTGRLRRLGEAALDEFGFAGARCLLIAHMENTTFDVRFPATPPAGPDGERYCPGRYLLRIHRPNYQTEHSIASELAWLAALRTDLDLPVPEPVLSKNGRSLVEAAAPGVPGHRFCSLLRWMRGRTYGRRGQRPAHLRLVGRLMARLHGHSLSWQRPAGFHRGRWDWDGLFGHAGAAGEDDSWVWNALPERERRLYREAAERTARVMDDLGEGPLAFGLIHADLHLGNVLFDGGEARPIDFDDCGFGHWLYDVAVVLHDYRTKEDWPAWRDALLSGYAEERPLLEGQPLPEGQLVHLDAFMAARCVSVMIWCYSRARDNPRFREHLKEWSDWSVDYLENCGVG